MPRNALSAGTCTQCSRGEAATRHNNKYKPGVEERNIIDANTEGEEWLDEQ
jgi:hypothetical protein